MNPIHSNEDKSWNLDKENYFLFRFQEENTCIVSSEFLKKCPECILSHFSQLDEEDKDEGIFVDFTVHYPNILISMINGEYNEKYSDDDIDNSLLKNDFLTLFPHKSENSDFITSILCKPIFDYCSKSNDSICCCNTYEYSYNSDNNSDASYNMTVDTMNFQDKYVYVISGNLNNTKINELKKLSRYFVFFKFETVSIESIFTPDLDITTVINNQYLSIFPNLPSFYIRFMYNNKNHNDVHEVSFSYIQKEMNSSMTYSIYKMNLYSIYDPSFVHWIMKNPFQNTIKEIIFNTTIDSLCCQQIPVILSTIHSNNLLNINRISFQRANITNTCLFTKCLNYTNIFEQINIKGINKDSLLDFIISIQQGLFQNIKHIEMDDLDLSIPFKDLVGLKKLLDKAPVPISILSIGTQEGQYGIFGTSYSQKTYKVKWTDFSLLFRELSSTVEELNILDNITSETINDMTNLFKPLIFMSLKKLQLTYNESMSFLPSLLFFLSSSFYPSLQTLFINSKICTSSISQGNQIFTFNSLQNNHIQLHMPTLVHLQVSKLCFTSEILQIFLTLFLNNCPFLKELTFQECKFDIQCEEIFYTLANKGLLKNIQQISFESILFNFIPSRGFISVFLPRRFVHLNKDQLKSLTKLYYSNTSFTVEDFKSYVDLFIKRIIPSTCLSLTNPQVITHSNKDIIICPAKGIEYLLQAIQQKQLTHLTIINLNYTYLTYDILVQISTYLNKEYLPELSQLYIHFNCNSEILNKVQSMINQVELVISNQLHYLLITKTTIVENNVNSSIPKQYMSPHDDNHEEIKKEKTLGIKRNHDNSTIMELNTNHNDNDNDYYQNKPKKTK
ncbi:hypothetical protein WA158_005203 [Blastocystis sp. Blastoise]